MNRTPYREGDLVHWYDGTSNGSIISSGIVLEVMPRNVYEPESCLILTGEDTVFIESKHLISRKDIK